MSILLKEGKVSKLYVADKEVLKATVGYDELMFSDYTYFKFWPIVEGKDSIHYRFDLRGELLSEEPIEIYFNDVIQSYTTTTTEGVTNFSWYVNLPVSSEEQTIKIKKGKFKFIDNAYNNVSDMSSPFFLKEVILGKNYGSELRFPDCDTTKVEDYYQDLNIVRFLYGNQIESIPDGQMGIFSGKTFYVSKNIKEIGVTQPKWTVEKLIVDKNNPYYSNVQNCIITKSDNVLFMGFPNSVIPNNVEVIGENAFYRVWFPGNNYTLSIPDNIKELRKSSFNWSHFEHLILPESLEIIGESAFMLNSRLKTVSLPSTLKSIPNNCFNTCSSLSSINFPEGLESIGNSAFQPCRGLENITIPKTVKNIGNKCFADEFQSGGLTDITFEHTVDDELTFGTNVFKVKNARTINIYHRNNPSVLNYDYAGDNITPNFIELES